MTRTFTYADEATYDDLHHAVVVTAKDDFGDIRCFLTLDALNVFSPGLSEGEGEAATRAFSSNKAAMLNQISDWLNHRSIQAGGYMIFQPGHFKSE